MRTSTIVRGMAGCEAMEEARNAPRSREILVGLVVALMISNGCRTAEDDGFSSKAGGLSNVFKPIASAVGPSLTRLPDGQVVRVSDFGTDVVARLVKGKTTRSQILAELGSPAQSSAAGQETLLIYYALQRWAQLYKLSITLDKSDILKEYATEEISAEPLSVPDPKRITQPTPGK